MFVCVLSKIKISHSNIIPIYYCGAARDRRGGSNRLWEYLGYGGCESGLDRLRGCDKDTMKSALIACASFHIGKLPTDSYTLFYNGKMCERTQISYEKM